MKSQRKIPMANRKPIYRKYEDGCLIHLEETYQPGILRIIPRPTAEHEVCSGTARYIDLPN